MTHSTKISSAQEHDNVAAASHVQQQRASMAENDAVAQNKLTETIRHSPQSVAQRALDARLNDSPRMAVQRRQMEDVSAQSIQRQAAEEEEPMQGKFEAVQRAGVEEEEPIQGKFDPVQRAGVEEEEPMQGRFDPMQRAGVEEEPMQGKFDGVQRAAEEEEPLQGKFAPAVQLKNDAKPNNTGLPDNLKSGVEGLSGIAMDDVQVHYNSPKPAQVQAHAYAQGTDIHVAPGQEKHLPHEAWHVAQQKQGRVQPTIQAMGVAINDDAGLEQEADVMGAKAVQAKAQEES